MPPTPTPLQPLQAPPSTSSPAPLEAERAIALEWLETDGLGGYAAGTVLGPPTRRYHGLLVSPIPGSAERYLFLSRLEPRLIGPSGAVPLAVPLTADGPRLCELPRPQAFTARPWPRWTYGTGDAALTVEILGDRGRGVAPSGGVLVRFTLQAGAPHILEVTPRFAARRADDLTFANGVLCEAAEVGADRLRFQPYAALPATTLRASRSLTWYPAPHWQRGLVYRLDRERGYDHHEDAFSPGYWRIELAPGESLTLAARVGEQASDPEPRWQELASLRSAAEGARPLDFRRRLELRADDFLYRDGCGRLGILAGFPWFGEWGRDTFLSLPGLTLARGRVNECWEVLRGALPFLRGGLLPNIFGRSPEDSHYGSADAALWFARAVRLAGEQVPQAELRRTFEPALASMAEAYRRGTELGLRFDSEWILHAGSAELNPTWMDARLPEGPVTPRHGAPVEIAALGHLLLVTLAEWDPGRWAGPRDSAARAFLDRFWLAEEERLADLWREGRVDRRLRPNMLLAAACDCSPLSPSQREGVWRAAAPLLTPRGLRTLAAGEVGYQPRYRGGPRERDAAYHQGTVWPWLLGSYVETGLRAGIAPGRLRPCLEQLAEELDAGGLGHVNEVYDAEPPHGRGGTFAQAWNTAELLRGLELCRRFEAREPLS